ncbi:hypothetical protein FH972_012382 [Carpinus fangiana]|uniref:Uncharacterized protein n=1 Tax=Carpinus fangiana TaxID=176857 RepID=A0A5N6R3L4_9ROSI|nr:hypothetical protein FH972_012382 [Carpinus fangiana]
MDWRVSQNHNINCFNTPNSISYQGDMITSMGKTNQKNGDGKKSEASNERVRGAEKSLALS